MKHPTPITVLPHRTHVRARRRIQTARYTLEHGLTDLLTTEDVLYLLTLAVADLDEAHVIEAEREMSDGDVVARAAA